MIKTFNLAIITVVLSLSVCAADSFALPRAEFVKYYEQITGKKSDVALMPLYESLREAAEDFRLLDQLKSSGLDDVYKDVMKRGETAWERTHFQWKLRNPEAEDLLAVRETVIRALVRQVQ